jgi:hypothetical protein
MQVVEQCPAHNFRCFDRPPSRPCSRRGWSQPSPGGSPFAVFGRTTSSPSRPVRRKMPEHVKDQERTRLAPRAGFEPDKNPLCKWIFFKPFDSCTSKYTLCSRRHFGLVRADCHPAPTPGCHDSESVRRAVVPDAEGQGRAAQPTSPEAAQGAGGRVCYDGQRGWRLGPDEGGPSREKEISARCGRHQRTSLARLCAVGLIRLICVFGKNFEKSFYP